MIVESFSVHNPCSNKGMRPIVGNKCQSPAPNMRHWLNQRLQVVLVEMFNKQSNVLIMFSF